MALSREAFDLVELNQRYTNLLTLAKAKGFEHFKEKYLSFDAFFQQAVRWEDNEVMQKRINQKTFEDALAYVSTIVNDITEMLQRENAAQEELRSNLTHYLFDTKRVKAGAALVAALDKNTPKTKRFKKNLGLGLLGIIGGVLLIAAIGASMGIFLAPIMATMGAGAFLITCGSVVGYELLIMLAQTAIYKLAPKFHARHADSISVISWMFTLLPLLPLALLAAPIAAGIVTLKRLPALAKNRHGLSLGLAKSFQQLKAASHCDDDKTNLFTRDRAVLENTYDAKIAKAEMKKQRFEDETLEYPQMNAEEFDDFVKAGRNYYGKRVEALKAMRTFEIERGLALSQNDLKEERCDLSQAEREALTACQKPNKNELLAAKHAFKFGKQFEGAEGSVQADVQTALDSLPTVNDHTVKPSAYHAGKSEGYIHGQTNAVKKLFMFERSGLYHKVHAERFENFKQQHKLK